MIERSKFGGQLISLRKIILDGISYYIVWQVLNKEYEDEKQYLHQDKGFWWRYRGFFAPARNALLWSTLLQLSKAFDGHPRAVSLNNLLVSARNNPTELTPYATQDRLEDIQVKILKNMALLEKLRRYRNQRVAHFDSELMEDIELSPEEVNTIVEEAKTIFNLLKFACEGRSDNFNHIMEDISPHTTKVINIIKRSEK